MRRRTVLAALALVLACARSAAAAKAVGPAS